jgi:preprotein translocase subunit SecF
MSRTIITHGSTQMAVLAMLFFGGETLHYFALALTIGILFGIYSSVLVASPIVMWLGVSREDLMPTKKDTLEDGRP